VLNKYKSIGGTNYLPACGVSGTELCKPNPYVYFDVGQGLSLETFNGGELNGSSMTIKLNYIQKFSKGQEYV
jgi:hypothetical protein